MKNPICLMRLASLLSIALISSIEGVLPSELCASEPGVMPANSVGVQQAYASSEEAVNALQAAAAAADLTVWQKIFGPGVNELMTGDNVQDANNSRRFSVAMLQGCHPVKETDDRIIIEVGTNNWPMPIPLVKSNGQWRFDTAVGMEEIINRHIGKDELHAIGVCRAYVIAQLQYGLTNSNGREGMKYAQKFKSSPGMKDGLYWPTATNEPASPFGPLVAKAQVEGYGKHIGTGSQPFHGYYFRILTQQGKAAPGGEMNYLHDGILTGGFALVAYPVRWDHSGIMTFIVNQDGKIFQRNLGEDTCRIAAEMQEYNPDGDWTLVEDLGVSNAVFEK